MKVLVDGSVSGWIVDGWMAGRWTVGWMDRQRIEGGVRVSGGQKELLMDPVLAVGSASLKCQEP